jgi:hypothetical protein
MAIFDVSAFVDATKQLERCGTAYDMFRALYDLPVVPHKVTVVLPQGEDAMTWGKNDVWFRGLKFDPIIATKKCDKTSLFRVHVDKTVVHTGHMPTLGAYCAPSSPNHPWVDRAVLVSHCITGEKCLVLIQDRVYKKGLPKAVDALNCAADALRKVLDVPVLCIANVVGATLTTAQDNFRYPFILVRDPEVESFYTTTFASAIRFVRQRHALSHTQQ